MTFDSRPATVGRAPPWTLLYLAFVVALLLSPGLLHWQPGPSTGPRDVSDLVLNALLLIPLGISLRHRPWWMTLACAAALSGAAEWLQQWLPREPDLLDFALNVAGAMVGRFALRGLPQLSWCGSRFLLPALWVLSLAALMWGSRSIRPNDFRNWDASFALAIGNEVESERPWSGFLERLRIWDRVLPPPAGDAAEPPVLETPVLDISFEEEGCRSAWRAPPDSPPHVARPPRGQGFAIAEGRCRVDGGRWLWDDDDARRLHGALTASDQLTIHLRLEITALDLDGPARILTFSRDPLHRNFTVAQRKRNVVLRVRTPTTGLNGTAPAIATYDAPLTLGTHDLWMSFDQYRGRIHIDGRCHCDYLLGTARAGLLGGRGLAAALFVVFALGALAAGGAPPKRRALRLPAAVLGVLLSALLLAAVGAWRHFPTYGWIVAILGVAAVLAVRPCLRTAGGGSPVSSPKSPSERRRP